MEFSARTVELVTMGDMYFSVPFLYVHSITILLSSFEYVCIGTYILVCIYMCVYMCMYMDIDLYVYLCMYIHMYALVLCTIMYARPARTTTWSAVCTK